MRRKLTALAALLAMTAQAHAVPGISGSSLQVSESAASTTSDEMEGPGLLSAVLDRFQMVVSVTTGKPVPMSDGSTYDPKQCSEGRKAKDDEDADASDTADADNAKPIFFAF